MKYFHILVLIILHLHTFSQTETCNVEVTLSLGQKMKGTYTIYYKSIGIPKNKITKPFIICEGLDFANSVSHDEIYKINQFSYIINALRNRGYDVLILNLESNTLEIEKNARLFGQLIKDLNNILIENGSYHRITSLGISMGGLVTRMGIAQLEVEGYDHRVENYISFDTPHRGANIPLGYQHMIDFYTGGALLNIVEYYAILDKLNLNPVNYMNKGGAIDKNKNFIIQTAALEMSMIFKEQNLLRKNLLNQFEDLGDFPQHCRKIAISNGVIKKQFNFNAGEKHFEWLMGATLVDQYVEWPDFISEPAHAAGMTLNPFYIGFRPISWENQVNAMPGDKERRVFHAGATVQAYPNAPNVEILHYQKYSYNRDFLTAPSNINIDHVPGGYFHLSFLKGLENFVNSDTLITVPIDYDYKICVDLGNVLGMHCYEYGIHTELALPVKTLLGEINSPLNNKEYKFCFVPILSSLNINKDDWFFDVSTLDGYPYIQDKSITPFDAIYAIPEGKSENTLHAHLEYNGQAEFILNEVAPKTLYIQDKFFPQNYTNIFEANTIIVGNDVEPNSNKTRNGDVVMNPTTYIEFHVPKDSVVYLKPGFNTNGGSFKIIRSDNNPKFYDANFNITPDYLNNSLKNLTLKNETIKVLQNDKKIPEVEITGKATISGMNDSTYNYILENHKVNIELSTYPNPVKDYLCINISTTGLGHLTITLHNIQGDLIREIADYDVSLNQSIYYNTIDVTKMKKGLYLLHVKFNTIEKTQKIVIEN